MAKFVILGKNKLEGDIIISGAKNAALKILPAAILANTSSLIHNVPNILDIQRMQDILVSVGATIKQSGHSLEIDPKGVNSFSPSEKLIKQLRGSIVVVGPLLAKYGEAVFSQPGGCLIGSRPIDDHLDVFSQLGVKIKKVGDKYYLKGKPKAGEITLGKMSVTATENAIMAAVLSPGTTTIHVAAAEPEIADLAQYLNKMGARVEGAGNHTIVIRGVKSLHGVEHEVLPDRIEAGTFLAVALATRASFEIGPVVPEHLSIVTKKMIESGGRIERINRHGQSFFRTLPHRGLRANNIDTRTYPGFPTDLQSPYAVLMTQAVGKTNIFETIFEGRFLYIKELIKMGAKIEVLSPHIVEISGASSLKGQRIQCQDIRGGSALVIAGLCAIGETIIDQVDLIDRGYEKMDEKLRQVGASIERMV